MIEEITNLDDLLQFIKSNDVDDRVMADLPNFGGEVPKNTCCIWSWDEDRILWGECKEEYEIITRELYKDLSK